MRALTTEEHEILRYSDGTCSDERMSPREEAMADSLEASGLIKYVSAGPKVLASLRTMAGDRAMRIHERFIGVRE